MKKWRNLRTSSGSDWQTHRKRVNGFGWTTHDWIQGLLLRKHFFVIEVSVKVFMDPVLCFPVWCFGFSTSQTTGKGRILMERTVWGWGRKTEPWTWSPGAICAANLLKKVFVRNQKQQEPEIQLDPIELESSATFTNWGMMLCSWRSSPDRNNFELYLESYMFFSFLVILKWRLLLPHVKSMHIKYYI